MPKRESDAATRALDELEALAEEARAADRARARGGALDKRSRMYKLLRSRRRSSSAARSKTRPTPNAGSRPGSPRRAWRSSRPARGSWRNACGTDLKRLRNDVDRLLLYALGQKTFRGRRSGDCRPGGAAGRLGDDQRDRGGRRRGGAAPARAAARCRRTAREDPRAARLAGSDEISVLAPPACAPRSTRSSGPIST